VLDAPERACLNKRDRVLVAAAVAYSDLPLARADLAGEGILPDSRGGPVELCDQGGGAAIP
jgi:hypothetical protein